MKLVSSLLALTLATPLVAQQITLDPTLVGNSSYPTHIIPETSGGYVNLELTPNPNKGFIQFTAADGVTGTTTVTPSFTYQTVVPRNTTTLDANNSYILQINSLSFVDANGVAHTGYGTVFYHFFYTRGSGGRGGGGAGWKLVVDSGTINLQ